MQNSTALTRWISGCRNVNSAAFFPLLAVAVVFGGGGVRYGLMNSVVQISALAILALEPSRLVDFFRRRPTALRILTALTLLLPLLQLLPFPPLLWNVLPGRELVGQSLALIDQPDHWMTWTVDPGRTLVALIGLLAPFTILISADTSRGDFQHRVLQWIAGLGIINVVIGAVQLASGRQLLNWYGAGNPAHLYGTFANHNSAGLFLVISLCALLGVRTAAARSHRMIKAALGLLLASGVFLTQSRSSIALLFVPGAQCLFQYLEYSRDRHPFKLAYTAIVPILVALAALGTLTTGNSRAGEILRRFDDLQDARPMIWEDTVATISRYWPAGTGIGTFDEVFQVDESLENVNGHLAGRAHNEYLEIALESGIFGASLGISWFIYAILTGIRHFSMIRSRILPPISIIIVVSIQSLLDYPLRNQAIMCVAAAMIALLAGESERTRET